MFFVTRSKARRTNSMLIRNLAVLALTAIGLSAACGEDPTNGNENENGNGNGGGTDAQRFVLTLENASGSSALPGPLSPGVVVVHAPEVTLFTENAPDAGLGLVDIAEDGTPGPLQSALASLDGVRQSTAFDTPDGAANPAPIFPGESYRVEFDAEPGDRLNLATMLIQSNDIFAGPDPSGIPLFDVDGNALSGDISERVVLWDAGSEANQAPGFGPDQAPRQSGPDTGRAEGVVGRFSDATRALPLALGVIGVEVTENGGAYEITLTNAGARAGLVSPLAPVFYVTHDETYRLFTVGEPDNGQGLEVLAEDGSPMPLVNSQTGAAGTGMVGAQAVTDQRPADGPGPAMPEESFTFSVTPTAEYPYLTLAAMVVASNDVFVAPEPEGVLLLDESGTPRPAEMVLRDLNRSLALWDAGTEANEVPGAGANQPMAQAGPDTGPADPNPAVRRYADSSNDLVDLTDFVDVTVSELQGGFEITIENTSAETAFPALLTPVAYAMHDASASMFAMGQPASPGLEALAEDGDPSGLVTELQSAAGVTGAGAMAMPNGATEPGPIASGESYTIQVRPTADAPRLGLATMVVPTNDTFLSLGPDGVALADESGNLRDAADVQADLLAALAAYDAGTEANQAGAAGPDQPPRQAGPNTGPAEGDGTVRNLNDPVWTYPDLSNTLRVTLTPQ